MEKPNHHILVCASFRASGETQGICHKKGAGSFLPYIASELEDREMGDVLVSSTGCLNICEEGPVMIVYPQGYWYKGVTSEDAIDEILDALEEGEAAEAYLMK